MGKLSWTNLSVGNQSRKSYPFLDLDNRKERKENYVGLNADAMFKQIKK